LNYNYTNELVSEEANTVLKDYTGGTDFNYFAPKFKPLNVLFVKRSGKKIPASDYKLIFKAGIGYIVIFPAQPSIGGAITLSYLYDVKKQPDMESVDYTRYNVDGAGDEGTKYNYIEVKNYPITEPSATTPIVIKDKNGVESEFMTFILQVL